VPLVNWLAIPFGLITFNGILLSEFPDYPADLATGKANLVVRLGRERASRLYALISLASWITVLLSLRHGVPTLALWFYLPILALSLIVVVQVARGRWQDRPTLEKLCIANLLVAVGTGMAYVLAFAFGS